MPAFRPGELCGAECDLIIRGSLCIIVLSKKRTCAVRKIWKRNVSWDEYRQDYKQITFI